MTELWRQFNWLTERALSLEAWVGCQLRDVTVAPECSPGPRLLA